MLDRRGIVALVIACVGCSDRKSATIDAATDAAIDALPKPPIFDGDVVERSGSRLAIEWWQLDGARQMRGIHDTALDLACAMARGKDGEIRCFPGTDDDHLTPGIV